MRAPPRRSWHRSPSRKKNGTHSCGAGRREFQVAAGQGKRGAPPGRIGAILAAPGGDRQPPSDAAARQPLSPPAASFAGAGPRGVGATSGPSHPLVLSCAWSMRCTYESLRIRHTKLRTQVSPNLAHLSCALARAHLIIAHIALARPAAHPLSPARRPRASVAHAASACRPSVDGGVGPLDASLGPHREQPTSGRGRGRDARGVPQVGP